MGRLQLGVVALALLLAGTLAHLAHGDDSGIRPAQARTVDIRNFAYAPPNITVLAGATVTWTNFDADAHTITADDGSWDSYAMGDPTSLGESWSHVFPDPGTFPYTCFFHPWMHGRVTVYASASDFQVPVAAFTFRAEGRTLSVDAAGSTDPDGTVVGFAWDFGDGGTGSGQRASHTYDAPGAYLVRLEITDDAGLVDEHEATVQVSGDATLLIVAGTIAGAVIAVAAYTVIRRKRRRTEPPP